MPATVTAELTDLGASLDRVFSWIRRTADTSGWSMTARSTLAGLDRQGATRVSDLARREGVTQPAITSLVNRLEEAGLVLRSPDPEDARATLVGLTPHGQAFIETRRAERARLLAASIAELPEGDQQALLAAVPALDRLTGTQY